MAILEALAAQTWNSFDLHDLHEFDPERDASVLTYCATTQREGQEYEALISSVYVQTERHWRLALHKQTPVQHASSPISQKYRQKTFWSVIKLVLNESVRECTKTIIHQNSRACKKNRKC